MKMQKYDRHSTADIESVVKLINKTWEDAKSLSEAELKALKIKFTKRKGELHSFGKIPGEVNGMPVYLTSLRLRTFATKGCTCSKCGLKASFFALDRHAFSENSSGRYHLNLWGVNEEGQEILFTHDHTLARGLGGPDNINNTSTMCTVCNFEKSLAETKAFNAIQKLKKHKASKPKSKTFSIKD